MVICNTSISSSRPVTIAGPNWRSPTFIYGHSILMDRVSGQRFTSTSEIASLTLSVILGAIPQAVRPSVAVEAPRLMLLRLPLPTPRTTHSTQSSFPSPSMLSAQVCWFSTMFGRIFKNRMRPRHRCIEEEALMTRQKQMLGKLLSPSKWP